MFRLPTQFRVSFDHTGLLTSTRKALTAVLVAAALLLAPTVLAAPAADGDTEASSFLDWSALLDSLGDWFGFARDEGKPATTPNAGPDDGSRTISSGADDTGGGEGDNGPALDPNG